RRHRPPWRDASPGGCGGPSAMAAETFYGVERLIAAARARLGEVDSVSIDIFDTLFIRRIHDPDEVKRPVAKFIADVAGQSRVTISAEKVWELRNEIEAAHRAETGKARSE